MLTKRDCGPVRTIPRTDRRSAVTDGLYSCECSRPGQRVTAVGMVELVSHYVCWIATLVQSTLPISWDVPLPVS